jgi:hypothetical protein
VKVARQMEISHRPADIAIAAAAPIHSSVM